MWVMLLVCSVYAADLTEKERKIYYDYMEADQAIMDAPLTRMNTQKEDVYDKYNLTLREAEDIVSRGEAQKLTGKDLKIYAYYSKKEKMILDRYRKGSRKKKRPLADKKKKIRLKALRKETAKKYHIPLGKVIDISRKGKKQQDR
jgi:hypothetical protein